MFQCAQCWQALFDKLGIYTKEETSARAEVMFENYITALKIEAWRVFNRNPLRFKFKIDV